MTSNNFAKYLGIMSRIESRNKKKVCIEIFEQNYVENKSTVRYFFNKDVENKETKNESGKRNRVKPLSKKVKRSGRYL